MAIARVATRAANGVDAPQVWVEAHLSNGLPAFTLVGLPETSVREARERVRSAIINAGFEFPMRRITVKLVLLLTRTITQAMMRSTILESNSFGSFDLSK